MRISDWSSDVCSSDLRHPAVEILVAEVDGDPDRLAGVVMGVDHLTAFRDPDNGSSLWALAVDPQAAQPGIGRALTLGLAHHMREAGRAFLDLSVLHDHAQAIPPYRQLGSIGHASCRERVGPYR